MKTALISTTSTTSKRVKLRLIVLLVLLVLSSMGVFGQSTATENNSQELIETLHVQTNSVQNQADVASFESKMDFMGWFMGTKQNQNSTISPDNVKATQSTKKQVISSGITPNKVLYRTFIKKVMNKDNAIA